MSQATGVGSSYRGASALEAQAEGKRYAAWIAESFGPVAERRVLEVGAGVGTISAALVARGAVVTACEPDPALHELLQARASEANFSARLATSVEMTAEVSAGTCAPFDMVVYSNVLEHIEDDVGELRRISAAVVPGGRIALFVPAHQWLFGPLDTLVGHHRRYVRRTLTDVVEQAGLEVVSCVSFDLLGVAPYWLFYRVLGRTTVDSATTNLFDRIVVPMSRFVQRVVRQPPIGKNVVLIAQVPLAPQVPPAGAARGA